MQTLHSPLLSLDELSHQPFWKDTPREVFRDQVTDFISENEEFIIDGSYRETLGPLTWQTASDIIWLDYPLHIILWRLLLRSIENIRNKTELWGKEGCVETWRHQFFSFKSLLYAPSEGGVMVVRGSYIGIFSEGEFMSGN